MHTSMMIDDLPSAEECAEAEIFIIDDEELIIDTLSYYLESAGFTSVTGFLDAEEAIAKVRFTQPDVIFTDIRMPGVDGNMLTKMMRGFPHLHDVPIIAITADPSFEKSKQMLADGAASVLIKPVTPATLIQQTVAAIRKRVELQRETDEAEAENSKDGKTKKRFR